MKQLLLLATIVIFVTSCKKEKIALSAGDTPVSDARSVLLKEVVSDLQNLPLFHFEYNSQRFVTTLFTTDQYVIHYQQGRVHDIVNSSNGDSLAYNYHNEQVTAINNFSALTHNKTAGYQLSYYADGKLASIEWIDYSFSPGGTAYKKDSLLYHSDGNLASMEEFSIAGGIYNWEDRKTYSNYDNKTNVDDFLLLQHSSDPLLFLPQVKLQKNNPATGKWVFAQNEFDINYTYNYNGNLPVKKTATRRQVSGNNAGQITQTVDLYSYY